MSSIAIYELDESLDRRLSDEARRRATSKDRLVKELLAASLGLRVEGRYADDYREFCGLWRAEAAAAFEAAQADNARVDAEDRLSARH